MANAIPIDLNTPSPERIPRHGGSPIDSVATRKQHTHDGRRSDRSDSFATPPPAFASAHAHPHTSEGAVDLDKSRSNDVFEEVDDLSELLSRPLAREALPLILPPTLPSAAPTQASSADASVSKNRALPPGLGSSSATNGNSRAHTLAAARAGSNGPTRPAPAGPGRIWRLPAQLAAAPNRPAVLGARPDPDSNFIISGSGARVPTNFLDGSGGYLHVAAEAIRSQQPQQVAPAPLSNLSINQSGSGGVDSTHSSILRAPPSLTRPMQVPQQRSADGKRALNAIDLTEDDDDEVKAGAGPSRPKPPPAPARPPPPVDSYVVEDDGDDDDEPIIVSSRAADGGEIVLDEQRNNAIVCLGMIHSVVLCMYGLPQQLTYADELTSEPPVDPAFDRSNFPSMTSFWAEKGYRPVMLSLSNPNNFAGNGGRTLPGRWSYSGPPAKPCDVKVGVIVPPLLTYPDLPPEEAKKLAPGVLPPFGSLADKYIAAMEPLLKSSKIRCEARCRQVSAGRAGSFLHSIEILVFARRPDIALVSDKLSAHGIRLDQPTTYRAEDYPASPEYTNPHNPPPAGYRAAAEPRLTISGLYRGSTMGATVQTKEATEKQKKEQVDAIYSSITSGEELVAVEPKPMIKTKLFQHQKQALSFLLEREQAKRWSDLKRSADGSNGSANGATAGGDPNSKAAATPGTDRNGNRQKKEEDSISLWTAKWDSRGKVRSYTHLITQREAKTRPTICRGAILADDMGLGKTITTIALIAHTCDEAEEFGDSDLASYPTPDSDADENGSRSRDGSVEEVTIDDFSSSLLGAQPPPKKKARTSKAAKLKRKVSRSKKDPEAICRSHLECRSCATLIVCPLSVVANWEEQIKEHWEKKRPPRIYIYHGNSRITDTSILSNHDIVLTTYPTLGYEFSNQKTWLDESGEGGAKGNSGAQSDDEDDEDDDAIIMVNENGIPVETKAKKGAGKKRKKKIEDGKESPNALQRIEWFRVVLDEAHYIKGALTWQSKAVCNLSAQRRLCLTGTPIQNSTDDLYALLKFLRLDPFTDRAVWNEFCGHKDNTPALRRSRAAKDGTDPVDSTNLGHIQIIMKFLALRRTKDMKAADGTSILSLPPKLFRTEMLEFEDNEKARYHALHSRYKEDLEEMLRDDTVNNNYATILHEILNLRLACDHPSLVDASKDAKRKLAGTDYDLGDAIMQDGLSRERATILFSVFRDSDLTYCSECQADLSQPEPDRDGLGASGSVDALDDALQAAATDQDRKGAGRRRRKATAAIPKSTGLQTPASLDEGSSSSSTTTPSVRPVVTRCQHLFCSTCFQRHVGAAWPKPKLTDVHYCPSCRTSLKLAIDAIQLEPYDFFDLEAEADRDGSDGGDDDLDGFIRNDDSEVSVDSDGSESEFDWQDSPEDKKGDNKDEVAEDVASGGDGSSTEDEAMPRTLGRRAADRKKGTSRRTHRSKGADDVKQHRKPKLKSKAKAKVIRGDLSLQNRTDLSTKIRALLSDLIPFSKCNPESALYDPTAPLLEHADPKTSENEEVRQAADPVVVIQKEPSREAVATYEPVKSVVFSQWTKMLDRIGKSLKLTGIRYARLDGTMRRQERNAAIERFKNDPGTEVLLISLRAGGTGLNLVQSNRAYLMDPGWNPAVENQGLDRIHRMGQRRPVITIKYIMKNSIEENMLDLQKRKMQLANKVGERRKIGDVAMASSTGEAAGDRKAERRKELSLLFR